MQVPKPLDFPATQYFAGRCIRRRSDVREWLRIMRRQSTGLPECRRNARLLTASRFKAASVNGPRQLPGFAMTSNRQLIVKAVGGPWPPCKGFNCRCFGEWPRGQFAQFLSRVLSGKATIRPVRVVHFFRQQPCEMSVNVGKSLTGCQLRTSFQSPARSANNQFSGGFALKNRQYSKQRVDPDESLAGRERFKRQRIMRNL